MPKKKKGTKGVVRLPSSDVPSQEDGWIELETHLKVKHLPYIRGFRPSALIKPDATIEEQQEALEGTYRLLARLVHDWDWKDADGDPYPKPKDNEQVFSELRPTEFDWLVRAISSVIEGQATLPKSSESDSPTS